MAVLERIRPGGKPDAETYKIPEDVEQRLKRGEERMKQGSGRRNECLEFWRGNQYRWLDSKGSLRSQATTTDYLNRQGKAPHRVRTTRNLLVDVVAHEVSAATQVVPSYEVAPSTTDQQDVSAAKLAEKVALYGYDKWNVRHITAKTVTYAVVADEGFAWPYFDNTVGPYIAPGIGQGEICIRTFGPNEVFWEPGVDFTESRWHAVQQARDLQDVQEMDGFVGPPLRADAQNDDNTSDTKEGTKLVLVTEYLQRPSAKNPNGRWVTIANDRVIIEERAYPCVDGAGKVLDEPVLHKLSYWVDPDSDRDLGLVRHLLDAQRTYNDCTNKQLEWKNLALNPQVIVWNGELKQRLTDAPGAVYHAVGTGQAEWRPVPAVPGELTVMKEEAKADIAQIAAQNDIPSNIESGKAISALIEKDSTRRASFIANVAEFHSRLMRHCLYLVQKYYTEDRLLKVRGTEGTELIKDFQGSQLGGNADVTVRPESIEPHTKQAQQQKIMNIAQMFPGYFPPEILIGAMDAGLASKLIEGYEQDVARAHEIIEKIKDGTFLLMGMRPVFPNEDAGLATDDMGNPIPQLDPTGQPVMDPMGQPVYQKLTEVPAWMPRPFDGVPVQKAFTERFMKTDDYTMLEPPAMEAIHAYYTALLDFEAKKAQRDQMLQTQMAEQQGMDNAAKPQDQQKVMGSLPALAGGDGGDQGSAPTSE